jgi:hypothetical protein
MVNVIGELQRAGFDVPTREEWGSMFEDLYQERRRPFELPAKVFFAHVTDTEDSGELTGDFKRDVQLVEQIGFERFQTGISYTWIVDGRDGTIAKGHSVDAKGAHTLNSKNVAGFTSDLNAEGHAIAWIGRPGDRPSRKCLNSFAAIIAASKRAGIAKDDADLLPHSKFAEKECPLESMRQHLPDIMRKSRNILET